MTATLIVLLIKVSIVLSVFAIGLNAKFSDTTYFLTRPSGLLRVLVSINVVMPVFVYFLCRSFDLPPPIQIALVVLAVSPVPPILPNKALKAGGQENYTISLLVTTALLSIVVVPLSVKILQLVSRVEISMAVTDVLKLVMSTVILPLVIGMLFRTVWANIADRIARPVGIISMLLLAVSVIPVFFVSARAFLTLIGDGSLLALSAFAIVGLIVGHFFGGPDPKNRPVLALACASRHPAIAWAIAHANFPNQKLVAPCLVVYLVLSALLSAPYLTWNRKAQNVSAPGEKHAEAH